jgi:hypothetical protein
LRGSIKIELHLQLSMSVEFIVDIASEKNWF